MALKYKNKKTVPDGTHLEKIEWHKSTADKQKLHTLLVPDAPMSFVDKTALAIKAETNYNLWKGGDNVAKITFKKTMIELQDGTYVNGVYFETVANDTDNAELFELLGYESYKTPAKAEKALINVYNTNILGVLLFILKAFLKTKFYNVEGMMKTGDVWGAVQDFPVLPTSNDTSSGFVSGALYLVRTQPVFTNGKKGEWTPWFEIRVR
ncbi:MAG: hypothetical protein WCL51_06845 [Bacteroidota bacterium]